MTTQRFDHPHQVWVFQERQATGVEAVGERTETFGTQRHSGVEHTSAVEVDHRRNTSIDEDGSVDPAHTVDRHLFDEQFLYDQLFIVRGRIACGFIVDVLDVKLVGRVCC